MQNHTLLRQKITLIVFGIVLFFILLEAGLRIAGGIIVFIEQTKNAHRTYSGNEYRIVCVGESTTAWGGVDSYPAQLEKLLNEQQSDISFVVINKGLQGTTTSGILAQLKQNIEQYHPSMVIAMMGINDGRDTVPYEDTIKSKALFILQSLRVYKMSKLVWLHLVNALHRLSEPLQHTAKEQQEVSPDIQPPGLIDAPVNVLVQEQQHRSIEKLEHDVAQSRDTMKKYIDLGTYYLINDQYNETAEKLFRNILELDPMNDWAYASLGWIYRMRRSFDEAETYLLKAIELNPSNDTAYVELAWLNMDIAEFDKTERYFKKAIQLAPDDVRAYIDLGKCYALGQQFDDAINVLEKAKRLSPKDVTIDIEIGRCYEAQGNIEQAERHFLQAYERDKDNNLIVTLLGKFYQDQKKYDQANVFFKKAYEQELREVNPATYYNYQRFAQQILTHDITLVCVQYPMRSVQPLRRMLQAYEQAIFVDNEQSFKDAVSRRGYAQYFTDSFGGDFGHCTREGNALLAQNIARVILKDVFKN